MDVLARAQEILASAHNHCDADVRRTNDLCAKLGAGPFHLHALLAVLPVLIVKGWVDTQLTCDLKPAIPSLDGLPKAKSKASGYS